MIDDHAVADDVRVHLPTVSADGPDQDQEWCEVETPDGRRRLRFHDYAEIFEIPGLYERLFYEELECNSPETVCGLLDDVLTGRGDRPDALRVLDVGAGNGMVAEQLVDLGAETVVGVDILEEAAMAAARDRPDVYDEYHVVDLTNPAPDADAALRGAQFNCMTTVAALGFGDIPPAAFAQAYDYVEDGGLVAFTIKERFVHPREDESGFSVLLRELHDAGRMNTLVEHRYQHRLAASGDPLHYIAYVAEKSGGAAIADRL